MKTKINMYYKTNRDWKRAFGAFCWIGISVCAVGVMMHGLPEVRNQNRVQARAEEAPDVSPLTHEQGFESADPSRDYRDTTARDDRTDYEALIRKYFGKDADLAIKIADCETAGSCGNHQYDPVIVNDNPKTGDYSIGLFQINLYKDLAKSRPSEEWLKNPENNVKFAKQLFDSAGTFCKDWKTSCKKLGIK